MNNADSRARYLLQIGLAFVFSYASLEVFTNPDNFLKYVPHFISQSVSVGTFLPIFSLGEGILVIWLLSGKALRWAAIVAFLLLSLITAINLQYFSVLFRNVAIAFASLALVMLSPGSRDGV